MLGKTFTNRTGFTPFGALFPYIPWLKRGGFTEEYRKVKKAAKG